VGLFCLGKADSCRRDVTDLGLCRGLVVEEFDPELGPVFVLLVLGPSGVCVYPGFDFLYVDEKHFEAVYFEVAVTLFVT